MLLIYSSIQFLPFTIYRLLRDLIDFFGIAVPAAAGDLRNTEEKEKRKIADTAPPVFPGHGVFAVAPAFQFYHHFSL